MLKDRLSQYNSEKMRIFTQNFSDTSVMFLKRLFFLSISLIVFRAAYADVAAYTVQDLPYKPVYGLRTPDMPPNTTYAIVVGGDTFSVVFLRTIYLFPPERFKNKKAEKYYWKLVRDVKKVYPLSKIVYYTLYETMEYLETLPDEKSREKHLRRMEKDLMKEYEPMLRKMSYNQGKVLLKLIDRQCSISSFELIRAYRGSFTAHFWQGVAKLFKADLKSEYDAKNKDFMIERIIIRIDQGQL
jgi:hypothetical protein